MATARANSGPRGDPLSKDIMDPIKFEDLDDLHEANRTPETDAENIKWMTDHVTIPTAGAGHNNGLMGAAVKCKENHVPRDLSFQHLRSIYTRDDDHIEQVLDKAYNTDVPDKKAPKYPAPDVKLVKGIEPARRPDAITIDVVATMTSLFGKDSFIFVGGEDKKGVSVPLSSATNKQLKAASQTVAQPMTSAHGLNKKGKRTSRCRGNTAPWHYAVVEIDKVDGKKVSPAKQQGVCNLLAKHVPHVLTVDSTNKSLHFWFDVRGWGEADVIRFYNTACRLGADPAMAPERREQQCRMPGGFRPPSDSTEGGEQTVHHLDLSTVPNDPQCLDRLEAEVQSLIVTSNPAVDWLDIISKPIEPVRAVIHGILGEMEKMIVSAPPKLGKTWQMFDLACAIASGGTWFGHQCEQGKVLFYNFEITPNRLAERLHALKKAGMVPARGVEIVDMTGAVCTPKAILADLKARTADERYLMIVLDPMYKMLEGVEQNDNNAVATMLGMMTEMAKASGAAIAFSHHFSKGAKGGSDQMDRASGAGAFARDPDAIITMTPQDEDEENHPNAFVLESTLRHYPRTPPEVWEFQWPLFVKLDGMSTKRIKGAAGAKPKVPTSGAKDMIMDKFGHGQHPKIAVKRALAQLYDVGITAAYNKIQTLIEMGVLADVDRNTLEVIDQDEDI